MRITVTFQGREKIFDQDVTSVLIGRSRPGQFVELDLSADTSVSRQHARIWHEDGRLWVEDLESRSGTRLEGEEIKGKGKRALQPGQIVTVGQTTIRVDSPPPPLKPPPMEPEAEVSFSHTIDAAAPAFKPSVDTPRNVSRHISLLYELPLDLAQETQLDQLLQRIVNRLVEIIPSANRCALLVKDVKSGELLLKAFVSPDEPGVSMTLARRAMEKREGFVWQRGQEDMSASISQQDIGSGMYAPLVWKGEVLGIVCVDNCQVCARFDSDDLRLMIAVAHHAAMAVATHQLQDDLRRNAALLSRLLTNFSPKIRDRLLDKARRGRLRLGGEKSEVTILFSDIRGFTRMSANMEAEDIVDMLNDYFPALIDPIFKNDGTIDKFVGDAILVVFGSPEPDPQQYEKAARAALGMQAAMAERNAHRQARGEKTCDIGIGIHCGEVLHGFIGSNERMEFTVIGDAVNRTSRYCSAAAPGQILISPELHQRVWKKVQTEQTTIPTKHEGDLTAYRVKSWKQT